MTTRDLLVHQFGLIYHMLGENLDGMTSEASLVQPVPSGNCANWIVGHLVNMQNSIMELIGAEPVWRSDQLARAGFDPIDRPDRAIDWETMTARLLESRERCLETMSSLSEEALSEKLPNPFGGSSTRAELLSLLSCHQTYHAGQLGMSRRVAGLDGAIRGPGQEAAAAT